MHNKGGGLWLARCRFRDSDGVVRIGQRPGPADEYDQHGKLAEDALIDALSDPRRSSHSDGIGLETPVTALVEQHLVRLAEDGRSPVTLHTYRFAAAKLSKFIGGVRVGEASPARIDAALPAPPGRTRSASIGRSATVRCRWTMPSTFTPEPGKGWPESSPDAGAISRPKHAPAFTSRTWRRWKRWPGARSRRW
jgi:hypothetical protein